VQHSGQASAHSAQAVFSGLIASGQAASAVSAVPLALSASAGVVERGGSQRAPGYRKHTHWHTIADN